MEKFGLYVTAVAIAAIAGMLYLMRGPNTALIKTRYRNRSKPKEETILIPFFCPCSRVCLYNVYNHKL
jgi:hypothetical protein